MLVSVIKFHDGLPADGEQENFWTFKVGLHSLFLSKWEIIIETIISTQLVLGNHAKSQCSQTNIYRVNKWTVFHELINSIILLSFSTKYKKF